MRITRKTLVALVLPTALCIVTATAAFASTTDTAPTAPSSPLDHRLHGTWTTTVQLSDAPAGAPSRFNALDTFLPGGALVVSSSAPNPTSRSLGQGSWNHSGHQNFTSTFVWFRFDASGQPVGTQRVRRAMKLSHDETSFEATDVIEVVSPTGAIVATLHGTEAGTLLPRSPAVPVGPS